MPYPSAYEACPLGCGSLPLRMAGTSKAGHDGWYHPGRVGRTVWNSQ